MTLFTNLINRIKSVIRSNNAQEITGDALQGVLVDMVNDIGGVAEAAKEAAENISVTVDEELSDISTNPVQNKVITKRLNEGLFMGEATPSTVPPNDIPCVYLAKTAGTYSNFPILAAPSGITLTEDKLPVILYKRRTTSTWNAVYLNDITAGAVDEELSDTSTNPVQNKVIVEALRNLPVVYVTDTEYTPENKNGLYVLSVPGTYQNFKKTSLIPGGGQASFSTTVEEGTVVLAVTKYTSLGADIDTVVIPLNGSGGGDSSITVDSFLSYISTNPVQNKVISKALKDVQTTADAALPKGGGTMTGSLILKGAPTQSNEAATKAYVDSNAGGGIPLDATTAWNMLRSLQNYVCFSNNSSDRMLRNIFNSGFTRNNAEEAICFLIMNSSRQYSMCLIGKTKTAVQIKNPTNTSEYNNDYIWETGEGLFINVGNFKYSSLSALYYGIDFYQGGASSRTKFYGQAVNLNLARTATAEDFKKFYFAPLLVAASIGWQVNASDIQNGLMSSADKVKLDKITSSGDGTKFLADDGTYKEAGGKALAAFRSFDNSMYASGNLSISRQSAGVYNISSTSLILNDYAPSLSILAGQAGFITISSWSASIIQVRTFNISGQPYDMGFYLGLTPASYRFV